MLVELPGVSVGKHVKLKGLKFHAEFVGDVFYRDGREVRLPRFGAHAGELRAGYLDFVIPLRVFVLKRL